MGGRRRRGRQASPSGAQSGMAVRLVHGAIVDTDDSHLTRHESRSTDSHLTSLAPPVDTCPGGARPLDPRHSAQNKYDSGNEWVKYSVSCRDTLRYSSSAINRAQWNARFEPRSARIEACRLKLFQ